MFKPNYLFPVWSTGKFEIPIEKFRSLRVKKKLSNLEFFYSEVFSTHINNIFPHIYSYSNN